MPLIILIYEYLYNQFRSILMWKKISYFMKFGNQIIEKSKNSINPIGEYVAYGYYFPINWNEEFIYSQIDPTRKSIIHLQIIRNRVGQASGKVLFKFANQFTMKEYIERYNEDFIITKESTHRVIIKPFQLKKQATIIANTVKKTKHAVIVKNLDFDITVEQLKRLAKDFGTVEHIEMHIKPNGFNNGLATVYFQSAIEAQDFQYFTHRLVYKERKFSSDVVKHIDNNRQVIQYLQQPIITLKANQALYKKMVSTESMAQKEKYTKT